MGTFGEAVAAQGIGDFLNHGMNFITSGYWTRRQEQREDTAVSRNAADMQNAGLSRTLAAGGQGHASAPIVGTPQRSQLGDSVMRNASLDIGKRQQDNQDRITQAQIENINAQSDLIRERIKQTSAEAGLTGATLSSYEQRLTAELAESASRIEQRSQGISQSQQEIKNLQEGIRSSQQGRSESAQRISESAQRISESQSRIRLNAAQIHLTNQAISKGEYAMRLISEEISNSRRTGSKMDLELKLRQMEAIKNSIKEMYEMREGNYHKSFIGRIASDLIETWKQPQNQNSAVRAYMEAYTDLLNDISQ